MATRKKFTSLKELFSERRRWVKGSYGNNHGGYCLIGGLDRVVNDLGAEEKCFFLRRNMRLRLVQAIAVLFPSRDTRGGIAVFNDHPETTFEDIQRVVRRARV